MLRMILFRNLILANKMCSFLHQEYQTAQQRCLMLEKMLLEKAFCTAAWPGMQQQPGHISKMHYTPIYTHTQHT